VTRALIERTLAAAVEHDAAVAPAVAVPWTVKEADAPLPARVQRTLSREKLWALQTPQVARREALVRAFDRLSDGELARVTDDLQVLELAGETTWLVAGDERNIKITTWQDLMLARQFLQDSSNS
jgi:2-C-methyl-D-erythritol 4-phosphate cytidylyltransferase